MYISHYILFGFSLRPSAVTTEKKVVAYGKELLLLVYKNENKVM
jgi:hypothetical protein